MNPLLALPSAVGRLPKSPTSGAAGLFLGFCLPLVTAMPASVGAMPVTLVAEPALGPPAQHGLACLEESLQAAGLEVLRAGAMPAAPGGPVMLAGLAPTSGPAAQWLEVLDAPLPSGAEAFVIQRAPTGSDSTVVLCGSDSRGLMYAALELADQIAAAGAGTDLVTRVRPVSEAPYLKERAVSIYTMQRAWWEERLHDARHWERYFDLLARSRINSCVIIFGYENGGFMAPPYPFFFDVPGFPEVEMVGLSQDQQRSNTAAFQRLIDLAHARGVDVIPAIWDHIYRGGVQGGGIAGASELAGQRVPGLVSGVTQDNLVAYNQAAMRRFLEVFPDIDGLQFRMHGESGLKRGEMEGFWHEIFRMIREKRPDLRVDLRAKELPDEVIQDGLDQGLRLRVATKYWMEQMGLPFHPTHVNPPNQHDRRHGYADLLRYPQTYRVHWRLWNGGTTRLLLWGDPAYVRRFAASARLYDGDSFEVNEMLATWMLGEPHESAPWDILNADHRYYDYPFERYWYFFQVWGRLGYNPHTPDNFGEREFARRFGPETGRHVLQGLHQASRILPRIVAASYRYSLFPTTRGWAEMMRIGDLPSYAGAEGSDVQQFENSRDAASRLLNGTETAQRGPLETSRWFADAAENILSEVARAERATANPPSKELVATLADLRILAGLARYHANRLPAGLAYNLYQQTGDLFALDDAVAAEQQAIQAWEQVVAAAGDLYTTNLAFGVHRVGFPRHWQEELNALRAGLQELRTEPAQGPTEVPPIAHIPVRRLAPGQSLQLRVTASVVNPPDGLTAWFAEGDGPYRSARMLAVGPSRYTAAFEPGTGVGRLRYYLELLNGEGTSLTLPPGGRQSPYQVRVTADAEAPVVSLARIRTAPPGRDLRVTADVRDPSGVKWVRLRYRHLTQFEDYQTAEMTREATTGLWQGTLPGAFIASHRDLMYYVEALDTAGNGCMIPDLETEQPYVVVAVER